MKKLLFYLICVSLLSSCGKNEKQTLLSPMIIGNVDDSKLVINDSFPIGDVRRYGVYPNTTIAGSYLKAILEFSSGGSELYFPEGYYPINLSLVGLSNISIYFDHAILGGGLSIIDKANESSSRIAIKGNLKVLDKIFIRNSNNIYFQNVTVASDTVKNLYKNKNRGVSIYSGARYLKFEKLLIQDTGGDSLKFYTHIAAALQVHGWNNNPEYISIDELEIENAGRTALYLTGNNHLLKKVTIRNFGLGSPKNMFGLEDSNPGDETEFSGAWINKCNNCVIDSLSIKNSMHKGDYSIHFGIGQYSKPSFINNVQFLEHALKMPLKDDPLTNILVKKVY